eukprot:TRINITY_DN3603_c0_g1_i4.p1 TRINITY_DN3603_c0_g1~~TRINITY_DN3603_c0_g1_i4.p1  ORF type:complete len:640 (-),score=284.12 TRINITY_DN3603_c0_g1_i4:222-2141(-)
MSSPSVSRPVWGHIAHNGVSSAPPSLKTLMQEEADARTARVLGGLPASFSPPSRPAAPAAEDDDDAELRLALAMSASLQDAAAQPADELLAASLAEQQQQQLQQLQHDYALALSLQQREAAAASFQRRAATRTNEKVSTVPAWLELDAAELLLYGTDDNDQDQDDGSDDEEDYSDEDDGDYDDDQLDDDDDDEPFESDLPAAAAGAGMPAECAEPARTGSTRPSAAQPSPPVRPGAAVAPTKHDPVLCGLRNASRIEARLESGNLAGVVLSNAVASRLEQRQRRAEAQRTRVRGNRADTHTNEAVLDAETRLALLKLLNSDTLASISGVISTGKEANVYHAIAGAAIVADTINDGTEVPGTEYAVKIYKTRLNEFRNRGQYIDGEFRFRHKRSGWRNPSKLIKLWAEKELRNLKRLRSAGIACPQPVLLKQNVLVMHFLGKSGFPSPTLKEASLPSDQLAEHVYPACVKLMRALYHRCRLIHADLSEYNLLWHNKALHVIDVAQSVEREHPRAMEFLKRDCAAVTGFFRQHGVPTLSIQQLFEFTTDMHIEDGCEDAQLAKLKQAAVQRLSDGPTHEESVQESIFMQAVTPRKLGSQPNLTTEHFVSSSGHVVTGFSPSSSPVQHAAAALLPSSPYRLG